MALQIPTKEYSESKEAYLATLLINTEHSSRRREENRDSVAGTGKEESERRSRFQTHYFCRREKRIVTSTFKKPGLDNTL